MNPGEMMGMFMDPRELIEQCLQGMARDSDTNFAENDEIVVIEELEGKHLDNYNRMQETRKEAQDAAATLLRLMRKNKAERGMFWSDLNELPMIDDLDRRQINLTMRKHPGTGKPCIVRKEESES